MTEQKLKQIYDLSSAAWKWFKAKDAIDVSKRDDFYWDCVREDIKKSYFGCDKSIRQFYADILNVYAGQLQKDYLAYLETKQEKLPL